MTETPDPDRQVVALFLQRASDMASNAIAGMSSVSTEGFMALSAELRQGAAALTRLLDARDEYQRHNPEGWEALVWKGVAKHLEAELDAARAQVQALEAELAQERAVCLCGCPADDHESLGEDGEQCGNEDHICLRVAPAVAEVFTLDRRAADARVRLVNQLVEMERAAHAETKRTLEALEREAGPYHRFIAHLKSEAKRDELERADKPTAADLAAIVRQPGEEPPGEVVRCCVHGKFTTRVPCPACNPFRR